MPIELRDLAGLSEPAKKLLETVSSGIGVLYEPTRIRRKARADGDALLIKTNAELARKEILARAADRLGHRELRYQENIDSIVEKAMPELPEYVEEAPVNPDWIFNFFEQCQSISDEQLQQLWSRILAGEVGRPGRFSRITLASLKNMGQQDARLFEKACSLFWAMDSFPFIPFELDRVPEPLSKWGLTHSDCLHLDAMGLLNVKRDIFAYVVHGATFHYSHSAFSVDLGRPHDAGNLNIITLTRAGEELYPLIRREYLGNWESVSLSLMEKKLDARFYPI